MIAMIETGGQTKIERRFYIASRPMAAKTFAAAMRALSHDPRKRAKTRCRAPYGCAEGRFPRFFLLCTAVGSEIRAALDMPRSFPTVCKKSAPRENASKTPKLLRDGETIRPLTTSSNLPSSGANAALRGDRCCRLRSGPHQDPANFPCGLHTPVSATARVASADATQGQQG